MSNNTDQFEWLSERSFLAGSAARLVLWLIAYQRVHAFPQAEATVSDPLVLLLQKIGITNMTNVEQTYFIMRDDFLIVLSTSLFRSCGRRKRALSPSNRQAPITRPWRHSSLPILLLTIPPSTPSFCARWVHCGITTKIGQPVEYWLGHSKCNQPVTMCCAQSPFDTLRILQFTTTIWSKLQFLWTVWSLFQALSTTFHE